MAIFDRLNNYQLHRLYNKKGWLLLCPIYAKEDPITGEMWLQERNWIPEWWLTAQEWIYATFNWCIVMCGGVEQPFALLLKDMKNEA